MHYMSKGCLAAFDVPTDEKHPSKAPRKWFTFYQLRNILENPSKNNAFAAFTLEFAAIVSHGESECHCQAL